MRKSRLAYIFLILLGVTTAINCHNGSPLPEKAMVKKPEEMDDQISDNIKLALSFAKENDGKINDSAALFLYHIVDAFYKENDYHNIWSENESWKPLADSLIAFINSSKYSGLYPGDYHFDELRQLQRRFYTDTLAKKDAIFWTKGELFLSDAFMRILKDLKEGRLLPDSNSIINNEMFVDSFFVMKLIEAKKINSVQPVFQSVEPNSPGYRDLKEALKQFVDSMDATHYVYLFYPQKDSVKFVKSLRERLSQSGITSKISSLPDSVLLSEQIKEYQGKRKVKADGKITPKLIALLNSTDVEKFKRIAVTLDRYKALPSLPEKYVWVNLPAFFLKVVDSDTVVLTSKIIIGKPATPTPLIISKISDMVTYPVWTIPASIIKKDVLPGLKKDPGYLAKKGFSLLDYRGDSVNPYTVKWEKYKDEIPWKVQQGSGDDNALGIFKFNFRNVYSVYLHDTNQRYLFSNSNRALSHGCVRVQKWRELAYYIAQNDSAAYAPGKKIPYDIDSIKIWVANRSRKQIIVKNKMPLFIEYFTCEGKNDKVVFHEDIYDDDKMYAEKYFANK
ncbi:MAG: L,D-transpeptidase family protein [Ginsengibacter sp.]